MVTVWPGSTVRVFTHSSKPRFRSFTSYSPALTSFTLRVSPLKLRFNSTSAPVGSDVILSRPRRSLSRLDASWPPGVGSDLAERRAVSAISEYLGVSSLQPEASRQVAEHLESCAECSQELEARNRVRELLRGAVRRQYAPPGLETRIKAQIREVRPSANPFRRWAPALVLAATVLVVAVGSWIVFQGPSEPWETSEPWKTDVASQEAYIDSLYKRVVRIVRVGLGDHVHCAFFRKFGDQPSPKEMAEKISSEYAGLIPIVQEKVPQEFRLRLAHQCTTRERRFVHLVLKSEDKLLSVILTRRRPEESFEADDYLVFVIADLPEDTNVRLAANLAPEVQALLAAASG